MASNNRQFTHMLQGERELWQAWLSRWGDGWFRYRYDVHVGDGISVGPDYDVMTQGLAKSLTQKRIDVVAERQGVIWIFEVKQQAALSALGQVLGYRDLYRKTYRYDGDLKLAIVSDRVLPDDRYLYEANQVKLFLVEVQIS